MKIFKLGQTVIKFPDIEATREVKGSAALEKISAEWTSKYTAQTAKPDVPSSFKILGSYSRPSWSSTKKYKDDKISDFYTKIWLDLEGKARQSLIFYLKNSKVGIILDPQSFLIHSHKSFRHMKR